MDVSAVPQSVLADAADAVAEKIDILLERATDAVLGAPRPGTPQWQQQWQERDSDAGRAALAHRVQVKIAIAELAGVDSRHEITRARRAGLLPAAPEEDTDTSRRRSRRTRNATITPPRSGGGQLSIW